MNYDNAQADTGTVGTIADSYVSKKVDLICAIATPSAMSAYNAAMSADIPVVYTAVSDPVGEGLAKEDGSNAGNITGSCDLLPVDEQLKMIRKMLPDAKKIGILYTTSEANSVSTIKEYKKVSDKYGFEIVATGINTLADVDMAAADLVGKVDCICKDVYKRQACYQAKDNKRLCEELQKALELAKQYGYYRLLADEGACMVEMLKI